jgi:protein transport protein SEC9
VLGDTDHFLDISKGHSERAADNANKLKRLNRSIFLPVITFNNGANREAEMQERFDNQRRAVAMSLGQTQSHIGEVGGADSEELLGGRNHLRTAEQLSARKEQRKRFQIPSNGSGEESDDERVENELDENLQEIGKAARSLHSLALAMGKELDHQNEWIDGIAKKTDGLDNKLRWNTERVRCYSNSIPIFI